MAIENGPNYDGLVMTSVKRVVSMHLLFWIHSDGEEYAMHTRSVVAEGVSDSRHFEARGGDLPPKFVVKLPYIC